MVTLCPDSITHKDIKNRHKYISPKCTKTLYLIVSSPPGLRWLRWRSNHFSIVRTESVLGRRLSAAVRMMLDDATRNVAAIPFKACNINLRHSFIFKSNLKPSIPVRKASLSLLQYNLCYLQSKYGMAYEGTFTYIGTINFNNFGYRS